MDKLRGEIWDYLYQFVGPQSLDEIARHMDRDSHTIRTAVDHEWFDVTGELVAIAYGGRHRTQESTIWFKSSPDPE